jgi:hypothetical protein
VKIGYKAFYVYGAISAKIGSNYCVSYPNSKYEMHELIERGASGCVTGSFLFGSSNYTDTLNALKNI